MFKRSGWVAMVLVLFTSGSPAGANPDVPPPCDDVPVEDKPACLYAMPERAGAVAPGADALVLVPEPTALAVYLQAEGIAAAKPPELTVRYEITMYDHKPAFSLDQKVGISQGIAITSATSCTGVRNSVSLSGTVSVNQHYVGPRQQLASGSDSTTNLCHTYYYTFPLSVEGHTHAYDYALARYDGVGNGTVADLRWVSPSGQVIYYQPRDASFRGDCYTYAPFFLGNCGAVKVPSP